MLKFLSSLFGSKKEKDVKELYPIVDQINAVYVTLESLSDDELKAKTTEFKNKISDATKELREEILQHKEE